MAREILVGKRGGPLDNAIHAASLRLEELKFGAAAGAQSHAVYTPDDPQPGDDWLALAVAECKDLPFTYDQITEAFNRYGFNNAVSYARSGTGPLVGVTMSWLDGFAHCMGAISRLEPQEDEMRSRWIRGYE